MLPVKREAKELVDRRRAELGLATYNDTIIALAKKNPLAALEKHRGIMAGAPPFRRDHLERRITL